MTNDYKKQLALVTRLRRGYIDAVLAIPAQPGKSVGVERFAILPGDLQLAHQNRVRAPALEKQAEAMRKQRESRLAKEHPSGPGGQTRLK